MPSSSASTWAFTWDKASQGMWASKFLGAEWVLFLASIRIPLIILNGISPSSIMLFTWVFKGFSMKYGNGIVVGIASGNIICLGGRSKGYK